MGRSRGFAHIVFKNHGEAQNAVKNLQDLVIDGRDIRINISLPRRKE
jgi:RNA recognition motif-containing protein